MKLPGDYIEKIAHCLEEEETDIYTMTLYSLDSNDMSYFSGQDRERVERIFKTLLLDTKRHAELLKLIVEMGS